MPKASVPPVICVVCGHTYEVSLYPPDDLCIVCSYFVPSHIQSVQAKKYVIAKIYKEHRYKLKYGKDNALIDSSMHRLTYILYTGTLRGYIA